MWELESREGRVSKNWCFQTVVFETLKSSLDYKKIKPVNPKGNQPWIFIERTDAEAAAPIPWPPDAKSQLTRKDPDAAEDWGQDKNDVTEDELVGWHHWLNGHEFEQAPGGCEGQGNLVCCSHEVTNSRTSLSNWTELISIKKIKSASIIILKHRGLCAWSCRKLSFNVKIA